MTSRRSLSGTIVSVFALAGLLVGCSANPRSTGSQTGQGVTTKTIELGIEYTVGAGATNQSLGINGANLPDAQKQEVAMVHYINSHGGIAGRKVVPVYFQSVDKPASIDAQAQAECADFTQDHHVFAVLDPGDSPPTLVSCLAAHNTPLVTVNDIPPNTAYYDQYKYYYFTPDGIALDQLARQYVKGLSLLGFFHPGATYGLVTADNPVWQEVTNKVLVPALTEQGVKLKDTVALSGATASDYATQMPNVVLKFSTDKVDHVLILDHGAGISFAFIGGAASEKYFPTYALNSYMYPDLQRQNQPAAELKDAVGVGFDPFSDVAAPQDTPSAAATSCLSIMSAAGETATDRSTQAQYAAVCDVFTFAKAALDKAGAFTPAGFGAGVESLGSSWQAALTLHSTFKSGKHYGIGGIRDFKFDSGCGCFVYTGALSTFA